MMTRLVFLIAALLSVVNAFAPIHRTYQGVPRVVCKSNRHGLRMAGDSDSTESAKGGEGDTVSKAVSSADGTYYDDEVEPAPKAGISDSMRERLTREASSGLDADKKQPNVILYIIIGVAVLVIAGGAGIFY
ncbi:hypothetical protein ACA910_017162 [Epithemia clementina (nom. ined.)]